MKTKTLIICFTAVCVFILPNRIAAQQRHTCSTFQIESGDTIIVGHNLDDYFKVPGMVIVNPRGIEKENLMWKDFTKGKKKNVPRINWKSKYGSITYSIFGRDLIDGGLNEAGLYIGEMTLFETVYPADEGKPCFYHCMIMQYMLDNFSSVDEVVSSFSNFNIDGGSRWHFFTADRLGNTAIIELIDGKPVVYSGDKLPYKVLCNTTYQSDLDSLKKYVGYGGERPLDILDKEKTKRSVRATEVIRRYSENKPKPVVDYSFDLLSLLDLGNNKWQIVCDISNQRMYFRTFLNKNIKYVDLKSFDFSDKSLKYIDVHIDQRNDVSSLFQPLTYKIDKKYVRKTWWAIDMGFWGNIFIKPFAVWGLGARMSGYTGDFYKNIQ
jgi:choloylglycine hydrolase